MTATIVILLSEADTLTLTDGSTRPCGFWAEELITAHQVFTRADARIILATPTGRPATVEPDSLGASHSPDPHAYRVHLDNLSDQLQSPISVAQIDSASVDGLFVPGGYGPIVDLHDSPAVGAFLAELRARATPIAAVCHGTSALLADNPNGTGWPYAGLPLTSFSDEEEASVGLLNALPFTIEQEIRRRGGLYSAAGVWEEHIETTGALITGQNPASTAAAAGHLVDRLGHAQASGVEVGSVEVPA